MQENKTKYNILSILTFAIVLMPLIGITIALLDVFGIYDFPFPLRTLFGFALPLPFYSLANKKFLEEKQKVDFDEFGLKKGKSRYSYSKEKQEQLELAKIAQMESIIPQVTLKKIIKKGSENPEQDMKKLIGLKSTKDQMSKMIARINFEKQMAREKGQKVSSIASSGKHMVFTGSPGTGKTTVARIMTGFLYKNGYIKENKVIEIDGNFLKAGVGNSSTKTKMVIRKSYGGVLFIDEAYALMDAMDKSGDEVIATLIAEMENNRDKFVLILAGYTNEMDKLLSANPGFKSRIKEYLDFPDYDASELREILIVMAGEKNLAVDQNAFENFDIRMAKERKLSTWGNARTVRNVLDDAIDKHAVNLMAKPPKIQKADTYKLMDIDFE